MKFSTIFSLSMMAGSAVAAPVPANEAEVDTKMTLPAEAIMGYLDLEGNTDVAMVPVRNGTENGLLMINTTIYNQAIANNGETDLAKREAEAKWHWLELEWGQPLYKREADADAKWHWLELEWGQPLYKREADADAKWHWLELEWGQPLY